jgi:hypothetical protein
MMDQQHEDNESYEDEDKVIQKSKYVKIGFLSLSLIFYGWNIGCM